jgi:hypothetical protein
LFIITNLCDEYHTTDLNVERVELHVKLASKASCVDSGQDQDVLFSAVSVLIMQVLSPKRNSYHLLPNSSTF